MGLSIYYEGKLNSPSSLPRMLEEVKDVAEVHNWKYSVFETEFPGKKFTEKLTDSAYGICFSPPKCEPICLTFLSNGKLCTPWLFEMDRKEGKKDKDILYGAVTKTQYAGIKIHKIMIDLLRHLSKKYFKEFKLSDESQYWETNDEKVMKANFSRYDDLMDSFCLGLETIEIRRGESIEKYLLRVMERIQDLNNKQI